MAEGGESALDVFGKVLTKLSKILGREPPFTIVTAELNAKGLITNSQLSAVKRQGLTNDQRGNEVAEMLRDKIGDSDNPNECLLKICDVFESDNVDYPTLQTHGANMRKSISNQSRQTSGVNEAKEPPPKKFADDDEPDGPQGPPPPWPYDQCTCVIEKKDFDDNLVQDIEILLMPATTSEEMPVVYYLKQSSTKCIETYIDGLKIYIGNYGESKVIVVMSATDKSRQGPIHAGVITSKLLERFRSIKYVVAIGVCFGKNPKKQKLGDVVVSNMICDFTNKREGVGEDEYQRGPHHQVKRSILTKFLPPPNYKMPPHNNAVYDGIFISTCSLIDNPKVKDKLFQYKQDALAGEMEGAGIMSAVDYAPERVEAIVIKGIGDWGDGNKEDTKEWKPFAAHAAAHYVHAVLKNEIN